MPLFTLDHVELFVWTKNRHYSVWPLWKFARSAIRYQINPLKNATNIHNRCINVWRPLTYQIVGITLQFSIYSPSWSFFCWIFRFCTTYTIHESKKKGGIISTFSGLCSVQLFELFKHNSWSSELKALSQFYNFFWEM